jgi:hypothetical protein
MANFSVFNILDLPACVLPVTTQDPAKDPKANDIQYFNDMDKSIHEQCKNVMLMILMTVPG